MSEQVNDELEKHDEVVAVAARRADREFRVDLAPTVVEGSSPALARAILNLVDNALKWSPPGTPVEVTVQQGVVSVRDHGPGIAADDLPHVFDRFYRAAAALGLAIVRQIAEAHGGTVTAERADGGGSLFTLRIPLLPTPADLSVGTTAAQRRRAPTASPRPAD